MFEVPAHLKAATRLGAAKEAGYVLVVMLDKRRGIRSLWLAEDKGEQPCKKRYAFETVNPNPFAALSKNAGRLRSGRWPTPKPSRPVETIDTEQRYDVVEHLGNEPENIRCVALVEAEALGVPIVDWPREFSRYGVHWPEGMFTRYLADDATGSDSGPGR